MVLEEQDIRKMPKICTCCKQELSLESFSKSTKALDGLSYTCKKCVAIKLLAAPKKPRTKESKLAKIENFKQEQLDRINERLISFIGRLIRVDLKYLNLKTDQEYFKILNLSIEDIKKSLEFKFEPWMSWSNYSSLVRKDRRDDNDPSTWTWHFNNISTKRKIKLEDDSFKEYWSLNNIAPISNKQYLMNKDDKNKLIIENKNKNPFSEANIQDNLRKVKSLYDLDLGSRAISQQLGISRDHVQKMYKILNINNIGRKTPSRSYKYTSKFCKKCSLTKDICDFSGHISKITKKTVYTSYCRDCTRLIVNENGKERGKRLRKTDPVFKLRGYVSHSISRMLKINSSSKENKSCLGFLGYSIEDLKKHMESHFEPWMTWDNYGKYKFSDWHDNDVSTWRWQLDHIIPQSDLPYASMEDENFKICWSLSNIRPYSAKQNNLDGVRRTRHKKNA